MAKGIRVGISNVTRKTKALGGGVSNRSRKIVKGYVGVGSRARQAWPEEITGQPMTQRQVWQYPDGARLFNYGSGGVPSYFGAPISIVGQQTRISYYASKPVNRPDLYITLMPGINYEFFMQLGVTLQFSVDVSVPTAQTGILEVRIDTNPVRVGVFRLVL